MRDDLVISLITRKKCKIYSMYALKILFSNIRHFIFKLMHTNCKIL